MKRVSGELRHNGAVRQINFKSLHPAQLSGDLNYSVPDPAPWPLAALFGPVRTAKS